MLLFSKIIYIHILGGGGCWVFMAVRGLSLVAESWGYSLLQCRLLIVVASVVTKRGL